MYDDNVTYRVGINWKDILIKLIMLILFVVILLLLFPKADLDVFYDTVYSNNVNTMKEAARNYYTVDRLPSKVGDKKSMTLKEMVDNHMLIRFTDKDGKTCDESKSYVEVTKISNNEYTLKVQLKCGGQEDYILETIGCTTVCSNGTCQTIINNGNNSSNIIAGGSQNQSGSTNNNGTGSTNNGGDTVQDDTDWDNVTGNAKDDIYKIKVTYYQHKKAIKSTKIVYTCPSGYTRNGTSCYKVYNATATEGYFGFMHMVNEENGIIVVDDFSALTEPKTKTMVNAIKNLKVEGKALIVIPEKNEMIQKSARNIEGVRRTPQIGP